jgi:hypothetical protein
LAANTVYTATVSAAVTNLDNTRLPSEYVWKFTTGTSSNKISTDPNSNATGVALNKTITANFSMVMDPTINTTNFTLKQGTTAITEL